MPKNIPHGQLITPPDPEIILKIKTLIVTDWMGTSSMESEEEAAWIADIFKQRGIELDYTHSMYMHIVNEINPKLVIMDYGGIMPGTDADINQLRELISWLENHPSRLAILWTAFTSRVYRWELEDEFKQVDNMMHWEPIDKFGYLKLASFSDEQEKHQQAIIDRLVIWFKKEQKSNHD